MVYASDQKTAEGACIAAFARIAELDSCMSDYRVDSELNRLCAKAGGPAVKVSPDLFIVLSRAREVSKLSNGAFDGTALSFTIPGATVRGTVSGSRMSGVFIGSGDGSQVATFAATRQ